MQASGKSIERKPMHPDDFEAHLAWVMAKRFHEMVIEKTFAEQRYISGTSGDAARS